MSDFSNDAATSMLRLGEKGADALSKLLEKLFKLIKYILETKERQLERNLKKAEIEKIRQNKDIEEARNYLNQSRGLVKAKYMQAAGKDLYPISQPMSPLELKRFNELAKTYGLNYYTMQNEAVINEYKTVKKELDQIKKEEKAIKEQGGQAALSTETLSRKEQLEKEMAALEKRRNDVIVVVFKDDLSVVENITERMNMEIDLSDIDMETEQIEEKQVLSEEDKKRLSDLARQKENIIRGEFNKFNKDNSEEIMKAALDKEKLSDAPQTYTFEDALSRACNRDYAKEPCYICERNNPDNYIEAQSEQMTNSEGMPYNNTSFIVYKHGQQLDKVYHRRATLSGKQTSSRGESVWSNIKKEMKESGDLGDDLIIFSSKNDYLKYKEEYDKAKIVGADEIKKETEKQVNTVERRMNREDTIRFERSSQSYRDYNGMINRLKSQLADHKMALNEQGAVCHSDTMKEIDITNLSNDDEKTRCAEAINIGKQIGVLKQLNDAQTQLAFIDNQQQLNYDNYNQSDKSEEMRALYKNMRDSLDKQSLEIAKTTVVLGTQYSKLEDELNDIRSVKIVENIQDQNDIMAKDHEREADGRGSISYEIPHREEHSLSNEQWSQAMEQGGIDISAVPEPDIAAERE